MILVRKNYDDCDDVGFTQPGAGPYFCVSTVGTAVSRSPGHPLGRDLLFYWDLLYLNQTCVVCVCQGGDKEDRQQFPHGSLNQGGERACVLDSALSV